MEVTGRHQPKPVEFLGYEAAEAEATYEQGREAVVAALLALSAQMSPLQAQLEKRGERIAELERRLLRDSNSSVSSLSPTAPSPWRGSPQKPRGHARHCPRRSCSCSLSCGVLGRPLPHVRATGQPRPTGFVSPEGVTEYCYLLGNQIIRPQDRSHPSEV